MEKIYRNKWQKNFNKRKLSNDKYILVSPSGNWAIINECEVDELKGIAISNKLFDKLEKKHLVITENNKEEVFNKYQFWHKDKYQNPALHIIEVTKECNLNCKYCHASAGSKHKHDKKNTYLTIETGKKIIDFILKTPENEIKIEFQGGESLLNFNVIKEIILYAKKRNRHYHKKIGYIMATNLIGITKDHCDFIIEHNISLSSSLDGPQSLHDSQRTFADGRGSFFHFIKGLKTLNENGLNSPGVITVITKNSIKYIKEIVDMYTKLNIVDMHFNYVQFLGYAQNEWEDLGLTEIEELESKRELFDYILDNWKEGKYISELSFELTLAKLFNSKDTTFMDYRNPCGMILGNLAYDTDGNIRTCDEGRDYDEFIIGNVFNSNYKDVLYSEQSTNLISQSMPNYPECEVCAYAPFCVNCPVLNKANNVSGETSGEDVGCIRTKFMIDYVMEKLIVDSDTIRSYLAYKSMGQ